MLRVFFNEKKGTTTALIENCEWDAAYKIVKYYESHCSGAANICERAVCSLTRLESAELNDKYSGTVTVREGDTFDKAVGESLAVKKAMQNHKNALVKAIKRWQVAMLKDIIRVSPESFDEALRIARKETGK